MRRSSSCPTLASAPGRQLLAVVPNGNRPGRVQLRALASDALASFAEDLLTELRVEAVFHTPAYMAGVCLSSSSLAEFPASLLKNPVYDESDDAVRAVGACLACPPDGESVTSHQTYQADHGRRALQAKLSSGAARARTPRKRCTDGDGDGDEDEDFVGEPEECEIVDPPP